MSRYAATRFEGQKVFKKGQRGNIFYIIQEGKVQITDIGENFQDSYLEPGMTFGEAALKTSNPRNATAIAAVDDTKLIEIEKDDFEKILGPLEQAISTNQNLRILSSLELFSNLGPGEKEAVVKMFVETSYKKGTMILNEDEEDKTFYIVKEGEVSMSTHDAGDKEISLLGPGRPSILQLSNHQKMASSGPHALQKRW